MTVGDNLDAAIIRLLKEHLSNLCVSCMDKNGNPQAPTKEALVAARRCLTEDLPGTLIRKRS